MKIRLATLNTWALPDPIGHLVPQRMRAIASHLPQLGLDAICFQEVWTTAARETLLAGGRRAGLSHAWHNDSSLRGSGLLVLSRLPIESYRFERFALPSLPPRLDHPDYYGRKGFVRLRLTTPNGPLHLVDTHLHARYASDVAHEYRAYRVAEIVQLAMAAPPADEPLVLLGDMNFQEGDPEYRVFEGLLGVRDIAAELDRREPTASPDNPFRSRRKPARRVDYVWLRDGRRRVEPREVGRAFAEVFPLGGRPASYSDHAGVVAEIELDAGRTGAAPPSSPEAARLAAELMAEGYARARRRRAGDRRWAGLSLGAGLVAAAGMRDRRLTRRRLLRSGLGTVGVLALIPSLSLSLVSELFVPDELYAFERLDAHLRGIGSAARLLG